MAQSLAASLRAFLRSASQPAVRRHALDTEVDVGVDDLDVDVHGGDVARLLSLRTLIYASFGFGAVGALLGRWAPGRNTRCPSTARSSSTSMGSRSRPSVAEAHDRDGARQARAGDHAAASMTVLMIGRVPIRCMLENQPMSDRANES